MFSHVTLGADDIDAARRFYDATLGALGQPAGAIDGKGRLVYWQGDVRLLILRPIDGGPATAANGGTIAFSAPSTAAADSWAAAGVAHGGTAIEDPPGIRTAADGGRIYLAYLRDPSGNKLCVLHRLRD